MGDSADASLLADSNSLAPSTLERATLTRQSRSSDRTPSSEREIDKNDGGASSEGSLFWVLIIVLLLLAAGNLLLTFFAMGVLRLGYGMESIELIPGSRMTKFFGIADLGDIEKGDGIINSYSDTPFSITGDNSKVLLSLRTTRPPPSFEVGPDKTEIRNVKSFEVIDPATGEDVFSTNFPNFGLPRGVKNLNVTRTRTARIVSPLSTDLDIQSDSTIRLKGNEGLKFKGKKLTWSADQFIYINALNGSIILDAKSGIFVEVNTLPLAGPVDKGNGRGQYKLCVCLPQGQLFRVPIPIDNLQMSPGTQYNCASFLNPCMS